MAKVSFKTKGGKKVSFTTKRHGKKRKPNAYARHVKAYFAKHKVVGKTGKARGANARKIMKAAARAWKRK